jgi:hypothetical protein
MIAHHPGGEVMGVVIKMAQSPAGGYSLPCMAMAAQTAAHALLAGQVARALLARRV